MNLILSRTSNFLLISVHETLNQKQHTALFLSEDTTVKFSSWENTPDMILTALTQVYTVNRKQSYTNDKLLIASGICSNLTVYAFQRWQKSSFPQWKTLSTYYLNRRDRYLKVTLANRR